jgi:hypothetical protein
MKNAAAESHVPRFDAVEDAVTWASTAFPGVPSIVHGFWEDGIGMVFKMGKKPKHGCAVDCTSAGTNKVQKMLMSSSLARPVELLFRQASQNLYTSIDVPPEALKRHFDSVKVGCPTIGSPRMPSRE